MITTVWFQEIQVFGDSFTVSSTFSRWLASANRRRQPMEPLQICQITHGANLSLQRRFSNQIVLNLGFGHMTLKK
jgi:hypothetical protein